MLKQEQYNPIPVEKQVIILYAAVNGYLNSIKISKIREFEKTLLEYIDTYHRNVVASIAETGDLTEETEKELREAIGECYRLFLNEEEPK